MLLPWADENILRIVPREQDPEPPDNRDKADRELSKDPWYCRNQIFRCPVRIA